MLTIWLAVGAYAATCDLVSAPDAAFGVQLPDAASRVHLLIEVWPRPGDEAWASAVLMALAERKASGILVLGLSDEAALLALAEQAVGAGHEVAVQLDPSEVPRDLAASISPLRASLRPMRKAAGSVDTVIGPLPGKASEALLGRAGFDTLLQTDGPRTAAPRLGAVFEGEPRTNVVLQAGPYTDACGGEPTAAGPFTPRAADRVAEAVLGAIRAEGAPTVRVVLEGQHASDVDAAVLGRWLDEVAGPSGLVVSTPTEARKAALHALRTGAEAPPEAAALGGRRVAIEQIAQAAASLTGIQILPRVLPNDLGLTEAFHGMLLVLADQRDGDVVRLGALDGPASDTPSALGQEDLIEIPRERVITFARALLAELPAAVPVSMRVDGHLLTAPELLNLLASAVRGEDPAVTRVSASPDPNARGQGWGSSTVP